MDLYERIYDIVRSVPPGKVTTYGQIAQAVGTRGGARLVGWALNAVALSDRIDIPCHRVEPSGRTLRKDALRNALRDEIGRAHV